MATRELAGRTALVTGGSRGIGRAICRILAREGADVAINYARDEAAAREAEALVVAEGVKCVAVKGDVSEPEQVDAMVAQTERALGPIDLLVTSAGMVVPRLGTEVDFATWQRVMRVNLDGTFLPVMAVKGGMLERKFGRIVCIASIAALRPRPLQMPYGVSKAAVIAFARSCSEAFAPDVRINTIAPGLIETDMAGKLSPNARRAMIEGTPMKRIGEPEEIAEMALFLLSERSSFTTGQCFVASGGRVTLP
jgi:3-oxoacyl-[acyl-carrier protein] reductase